MALNALESEMVTFTGTPGIEANGIIVGYRAEYTPRTSTELKYRAIEDRSSDVSGDSNHRGQYYIQLGEQLYDGKLTKKYARDDFERPSINWQYDGKEIGTYVDYELLVAGGTYTVGVKGSELYDLLTYSTIRDNDLLTYVDGVATNVKKEELVRSNKNNVNASGTGVLTEVFLDESRDEIIITGINTYLAKANSDYNKTNESLSLKVYTGRAANGGTVTSTTKIVDSAVVAEAANVAKDDFKLIYMSGKESATSLTDYTRFEVVRMFDTNIVAEASITKWAKKDNIVVGDFTADGNEYKTNVKGFYDGGNVLTDYNENLLTDMSYNIYEDRYGNAIGVDLAEGTKNYVFITGYDRLGSNISVRTADAAAIFMDGTMDVITVNVTDTNKYIEKSKNGQFEKWQNWNQDAYGQNGRRSENRWYTYTVNNNGVYTLKPVERFFWTNYADLDNGTVTEKVLNTANLFVDDSKTTPSTYVNQGRAYGNDNSVYITVDVDEVDTSVSKLNAITEVDGVYTGAQNVKLELNKTDKQALGQLGENNAAYIYSIYDSNYYLIASVVLGEAQGATANYAYILGDAKNERIEYETSSSRANGDPTYYWEFDAVVNGEKTTLTAKTKYASVFSGLEKFHVQELRYDGEYVVKISDVKPEKVMLENNKAITDKMDVYDVGHVQSVNAGGMRTDTGNEPVGNHANTQYQYSSHRLDGTIELVGRTLYVERGTGRDVGLALTSDAKAVLVQYENGEREVTSCGSVSEAVGRLADAETDNNRYPGTQFRGRIVAALESNGAARWVVIISDTPLTTTDKDYNYNYSTTINNVEVRLVNSSTSSVQNRNITATLDRNGELTIGIPVASNVIGASASRVTATVDGVYRADTNVPSFAIRGSQAQWTLTGQNLTENNRIVVTIYDFTATTGAQAATITKNDPDNAATVSPSTGLYVGDTFTLTVKSGYKATVSGATKNADGTYTITSANVVVNVTKNQVPAGEVAIVDKTPNGGAYAIKADDATAKITSAKAGDKIRAVPSRAVEFTAGVTANADGSYTVTGDVDVEMTAKTGWVFSPLQGFWSGTDADGNMVFVPTGPLYGSLASFALAREAVDPTTQWLKEAINDTKNTYTVKVGTYTWVSQREVDSTDPADTGVFMLVPDAATKAAGAAATKALQDAMVDGKGMTVDKEENTTPVADSNIKVVLSASAPYTAKISEYVPTKGVAVDGLTKAEVVAALTAAAKAAGKDWTFTEDGVDFAAGTAAVSGTAIKVSLTNAAGTSLTGTGKNIPTQVWKVTYPGGEFYSDDSGKTVNDVTAGVRALLPEATKFGATSTGVAVTVADAKKPGTSAAALTPGTNAAYDSTDPTSAQYVDAEYKAAAVLMAAVADNANASGLQANGIIQDATATNGLKLLVATVVDPQTGVKVGLTPADYIQAGTTIYFSAGSELTTPVAGKYTHAGKSVTLTVDGKTKLTFTVGADGTISGDQMTYTVPGATSGATLTFTAALTAPTADIMVDGVKAERKDMGTPNNPADDVLVIPGSMKGYSLIYKDTDDGVWKNIAPAAVDVDGVATVSVSSLASLKIPVENGALQLKRGYSVANQGDSGCVWTAHTKNEDGTLSSALSGTAYYPVGTTEKVYIQSPDENTILGKANSTAMPSNTYYQVLAGETSTTKPVWEVPVTGNIAAGDYVALITVTASDAANYGTLTGALTKDAKNTITINGGTASKYVTLGQAITGVTGKFETADASKLANNDVTVTVEVKANKDIVITWVSAKDIDQPASSGDDLTLGKLVLDFGAYELTLDGISLIVPKAAAAPGG